MANQEELSEEDVLMMRLAEQTPFVGMLVNLRLGVGVEDAFERLFQKIRDDLSVAAPGVAIYAGSLD